MALITLADMNGRHFLGSAEGENLIAREANNYYFREGLEFPTGPIDIRTGRLGGEVATAFFNDNAIFLAQHGINADRAAVLAYVRLLAVNHGLVHFNLAPADYHVDYRETVRGPEMVGEMKGLSDAVKERLGLIFADMVCSVAFVFRARGHHYLNDLQALYARVWEKTRIGSFEDLVSWELLSTVGLHAVYPIVLDNFWGHCVHYNVCNGALVKRYDTAPAGAAAVYVLHRGASDLLTALPGARVLFDDDVKYLEEVHTRVTARRFVGSINARYYNEARVHLNEAKMNALAATIRAVLESYADNSPMLQSAALRRIAQQAPITGAILAQRIRDWVRNNGNINQAVAVRAQDHD